MNLEELSTSQIVLLTLFTSFVTSIATGVITVSLMQQAPVSVAQTVNRVIEQTVEKVAPSQSAAAASAKPVVVTEATLISSAVSKVAPSIVRIYPGPKDTSDLLGIGIVIGKQGLILTDAAALAGISEATVALPSGELVRAFVTTRDAQNGLVYLTASSSTPLPWTPATLSGTVPPLGQTVVTLSGNETPRIAEGLVVSLVPTGGASSTPLVSTDVPANSIEPGSPLVTPDGSVIAISSEVSRENDGSTFLPVASWQSRMPQ